MRLLHIIAGGRNGGAERFFIDLATALNSQGVQQHAFTRPYANRIKKLSNIDCEITLSRMGGFVDFISPLRIRSAVKRFKPDIVLAWMSRAANLIFYGNHISVGRLGGYYKLKYFQECDHLLCNTPDLVDYCIKSGWSDSKVHFIPNFSPSKKDIVAVSRESLNTPKDAIVTLVLARLEEHKSVDLAIKSIEKLPDTFLWIAGEGSQQDKLKALGESLGVSERIRFLGWRDDREALLKAADVCLVTSESEPFGNVVINAWMNNTPVVATDSKGPAYLIEDRSDGLLSPVNNLSMFSNNINQIVKDKKLSEKLVFNGKQKAERHYSEKVVISAYLSLFSRLLTEAN